MYCALSSSSLRYICPATILSRTKSSSYLQNCMNRSVAPSMASGESLFNPNNIHFTTRNFSTPAYDGNGVLGIVRESYNKWERRVPLTPDQVRELVRQHDYEVIIQPSNKRIFTNKEYKAVGAKVQDDLSSACVILGVKQVEEEKVRGSEGSEA